MNSPSRHVRPFSSIMLLAGLLLAFCMRAQAVDIYAVTPGGILMRFDSAQPATPDLIVLISGIGVGESMAGIDFRPSNGRIYALTVDAAAGGHLYILDGRTGSATPIGILVADPTDVSSPYTALTGTQFGVNFNPVSDRLRVVSDTGMNIRVNPATGLVTTDTSLNPNSPQIVGVAYSNSFAGSATTTLYDIDSATDSLLIQNPPNNGTLVPVGALGVDTSSAVGFDIYSMEGANVAYATLSVAGVTALYSVNLATGAATLLGNVGGNPALAGISADLDTIFRNGFD